MDQLQVHLISLLRSAHTAGVSLQEIVGILRAELAVEAEVDAPGHHMLVQIIDLGPFEPALSAGRTTREPELLHSRSLGQGPPGYGNAPRPSILATA